MRKIYICSAYNGNVEENIEKTKGYCKLIVTKFNAFPVAPNLYLPQFLNEDCEIEKVLISSLKLDLMRDCKWVYVFNDITKEMAEEIKLAWKNERYVDFFKYDEKTGYFNNYRLSYEERKEIFG